jgi:hypothetical protein
VEKGRDKIGQGYQELLSREKKVEGRLYKGRGGCGGLFMSEAKLREGLVEGTLRDNMHERFGHGIERGHQTCAQVCDLVCLCEGGWGATSRRHSCVMEIGETCFDASAGCENSGWMYETANLEDGFRDAINMCD